MEDSVFDESKSVPLKSAAASNGCTPLRQTSNFRIRTASVALRVEINPPVGLYFHHIAGDSAHSCVMAQGEEILHYVIYKQLSSLGFQFDNESFLLSKLFRTDGGFILLQWEKLSTSIYKTIQNHMNLIDSPGDVPLPGRKCHCPRRISPNRCSGFQCSLSNSLTQVQSFRNKVLLLLTHSVSACVWCMRNSKESLVETVIREAFIALDGVCRQHDTDCHKGWKCVMELASRPSVTADYYPCQRIKAAVCMSAGVVLSTSWIIFYYRHVLWQWFDS